MRFIKLFEKMLEWEWYDDPITFKVFMHLLLTANWKDTNWHGIKIKRGQRVFSYQGLADELHLSPKQIRTAITHLKRTKEVASERAKVGANKGQIITVEKYEKYQGCSSQEGKQQGKPEGRQRATDIEYIELLDKESTTYVVDKKDDQRQIPPALDMVRDYCLKRNNGIDAEKFYDYYEANGWYVGSHKMKDWKAAVRTWEKKENHSGAVVRTVKDLKDLGSGISQEDYERMEALG